MLGPLPGIAAGYASDVYSLKLPEFISFLVGMMLQPCNLEPFAAIPMDVPQVALNCKALENKFNLP